MKNMEVGVTLTVENGVFKAGFEAAKAEMASFMTAGQRAAAGVTNALVPVRTAGTSLAQTWQLNRAGMMELQASGINAFQALAAGMDPFRVAMMEGSQVLGGLVQGGLVSFQGVLAALVSPLGLVTAGIGAAAAAYLLLRDNTDIAGQAATAYADAMKQANDLTELSAQLARDAAYAKQGEAAATVQNAIALQAEAMSRAQAQQKQAEADAAQIRAQLERDKSGQGGVMGSANVQKFTEGLAAAEQRVVKFAAEASQAAGQIDLLNQKLSEIYNPQKGSKLADGLYGKPTKLPAAPKEDAAGDLQKELAAELAQRQAAEKVIEDTAEARALETRGINDQIIALGLAGKARAQLIAVQQAQQAAMRNGDLLSEEDVNRIRESAGALYDAQQRQKDLTDSTQEWKRASEDATRTIADGIGEMVIGANSFNDVLGNVVASLEQMAIKLAIVQPLEKAVSNFDFGNVLGSLFAGGLSGGGFGGGFGSLFGSLLGSIFGGGVGSVDELLPSQQGPFSPFHSGGVVGRGGGAPRFVDSRIFAGAHRAHTGALLPGEVPIIAKKGEGIFTPRQMDNADAILNAALRQPGGITVQVIDKRGADAPPIEVHRSRGADGREVMQLVVGEIRHDIANRGPIGQTFSQTFGLSYAARPR